MSHDALQPIASTTQSLREIHDNIVAAIGEGVYVSVNASWTLPNGDLASLTYSTAGSDEDEEDVDEEG